MFLPNDGQYTYYTIDSKYSTDKVWRNQADFYSIPSNLRYIENSNIYLKGTLAPPFKSFEDFSKETDLFGTKEEVDALQALDLVSMYNPNYEFRVTKVTISQKREFIEERKCNVGVICAGPHINKRILISGNAKGICVGYDIATSELIAVPNDFVRHFEYKG